MVVDVHSHFFEYPRHFSPAFIKESVRGRNREIDLTVRWADYAKGATNATHTVVFGGKAKLAGLWVPDDEVAAYVATQPGRLIGYLSLDPTQPGWQDELRHGHQDLKLKGIKLMPMYAGFYPNSRDLDPLWEYATRHSLPVLLHTGTTFISNAPLDCTLPRLLDDVAIRFPEVRMVLAHLGHPYEGECVVTIRKHANLYADCSALHYRPFQLYHSLMLVQEYGVWDKVLFGSDYPFTTVDASITGMRALNDMLAGTALPRLDMDAMERLFTRDSLSILGIAP
ncbi:amidohydrolase family protein [Bryobacter aggregatus]|uniref:amidohydrolase family protein n=1 Tax=Bryobacter aggregatus TaxID=360054 RepID=UPI0004E13F5C|nr:amidohydrolase family protein [Bryobacter aggregatus]